MPTRSGDGTGSTTAAQRRRNREAIQAQKARQFQEAQARRALAETKRLTAQRIREGERKASPRNVLPVVKAALTGPPKATKVAKETLSPLAALHRQSPVLPGAPSKGHTKEASVGGELVTGIGKQLYEDVRHPRENKLNLLLDVLAFGSLGTSALARGVAGRQALREGTSVLDALKARPVPEQVLPQRLLPDRSGIRKVRAEGSGVEIPLQSRNIPTAAAQHAFDRLSELAPGLRGVGAKARIARRIPEQQALRQLRMTEKAIPLAVASNRLRTFSSRITRATTPAEAAYTVVARYGHVGEQGVNLLDKEIAFRRAQIPSLTGRALERQQQRIDLLEAAKPLVKEPTEELTAAYTLGKGLSEKTTELKKAREKNALGETQAEAAPLQHGRIIEGAEYVKPTMARTGRVSPALERQEAYVVRLQKAFDRSLEQEKKAPKKSEVHRFGDEGTTSARSSRSTRLGAALSVEKDKLIRMRAAAAKRIEPTGLVGAEDFQQGPLGFFTPDRKKLTAFERLTKRKRSIKPPDEKIYGRTGATFTAAEEKLGPQGTISDYLNEARLTGQQADYDLLESFSKPLEGTTFDPKRQRLFDPNGKSVPQNQIMDMAETELEGLSPTEIAQRLLQERTEWAGNVLPAIHDLEKIPEARRAQLRVVDKKIADAIEGLDVWQAPAQNALLKLLDASNALNRTALVYLNPAYGPVQRTGNWTFLGLQQGIFAPVNMAAGARFISKADPELMKWIDLEVGGGAAQALLHEGTTSVLAGPQQKLADIQNVLADRGPRRQAWLYEAAQEGYKTEVQIRRLRDNPDLEPVLNRVSERAQQAMVKFRRTPTSTRKMLSRAIFILPWIEGSTRYAGRLILDHPVNARIANEIRDQIKERQERLLKGGQSAARGFIPIVGAKGFNPQGLSPLSTPADLAATLEGFLSGHPEARGLRPISYLQPTLTAGFEAATGINTYGGYPYPESMSGLDIARENLLGTPDRPVSGVGNILATAFRDKQAPTGPVGKQPVYMPEGGAIDALKRAALGSARPREVNLPAAQAKAAAQRRSNMNALARVKDDGKKMSQELQAQARQAGLISGNERLPSVVTQAVRLRTARYENYARKGAKTQGERLLADVQQLVSQGKLGRENIAVARGFLRAATDRQIEHQRELLGTEFYGTDVLAQTRREINDALERNP